MPGQTLRPVRSLGVLTGGGDVPGLNAAIKALVYRAEPLGIRIMGLRLGWEGITLLNRSRSIDSLIFDPEEPGTWQNSYLMPLNKLNTRTIDREGGTILQSSRTNPAHMRVKNLPPYLKSHGVDRAPDDQVDLTDEVLANLSFLELDGLVVMGGDDTLSYAATLSAKGVPIWGYPRQWIMMCLVRTIVSAFKQQLIGRENLSTTFAQPLNLIARPSYSACLA